MISGVYSAGQILNLFTTDKSEWGAADVGRSLGISRSHAHRLLCTLAEVGLLVRAEPGGRFRLSWTWFGYANVVRTSDPLIAAGVPIMRKLGQSCGLKSLLAVWRDGAVISYSPEAAPSVVRRDLSDCTALGLVLMAGLPDDDLSEHISADPPRAGFPPPDVVHEAIRRVRAGQLLVDPDAGTDGRWVAAPIWDCDTIVAALGVYAEGLHDVGSHMAIAVLKKASASLTAHVRRTSRERSWSREHSADSGTIAADR